MTLPLGMIGPFETLTLKWGELAGVDFAALGSGALAVSAEATKPDGTTVAVGPWVVHSLTATSGRATWTPAGSEVDQLGTWRFAATLMVSGQPARIASFVENVVER